MPDPSDRERAAHQVESEIEELGDPEAAPALPSTTLAAAATAPAREDDAAPSAPVSPSTTGEILRLAWPVMLTGALVSMAGLIDRAMIGRLEFDGGAAIPLAAVGFATQFFFLIQSTLFAIGLSCVALMARALGAGDPARARQALSASLQVTIVVTAVLMLATLTGGERALEFLGAEPAVIEAALPYLRLVIGSSLFLGLSLTFDSALRANRDTRTPMWIAMVGTVVKLFFNWVLIFGNLGAPRLELVGAGLATVISQLVTLLLFGIVFARQHPDSPLSVRAATFFQRNELRRDVIRVAVPGIAERLVMNLALLAYFWVLGRYYGTVSVAAYTVGVALLSFTWIPGQGYATACATLVGQALGAGDPDTATRTGWRSAGLALVTAVLLGAIFAWARYPLARLFTDDVQVVEALGPFMLTLAIAQPFLQLHFTLGGAHRGAGDTTTPLVAATLGNWALRVPLAIFFAVWLEADVIWIWITIIFDHVARSLWLLRSFRRGKWRTRLERAGR
ncbi:MAG: MATE family efflux transporter [Proteobacteria bacterium]|nr:MATE family efflux transporter [Pseudomonadota bacterium]